MLRKTDMKPCYFELNIPINFEKDKSFFWEYEDENGEAKQDSEN